MKILWSLILCLPAILSPAQYFDSIINPNWAKAGYHGNKDSGTVLNILDHGGLADSLTDNSAALLQAFTSLQGESGTIYFPAGKYMFNNTISLPNNIILKGDGADATFLFFDLPEGARNAFIISGSYKSAPFPILNKFKENPAKIVVGSGHNFAAGDYLELNQENDDWDIVPASWAKQSVGQMVDVLAIDNDTLTIFPPLNFNMKDILLPAARKVKPAENIGITCLSITRLDEKKTGSSMNISISLARNCFIEGIEGNYSNGSHILISTSSYISVTGSYFHHAFDYSGVGTRGYGVTLNEHANLNLVENNVFDHLRHAMMLKTGANENVIAYNYSNNPYRTENPHDLSGDISLHGHFPYNNLIEGNVVQNIIIDHYWGPSGEDNVFFRNRAEDYGIILTQNKIRETDHQVFIGNEMTNPKFLRGLFEINGAHHLFYSNNIKGVIKPLATDIIYQTSMYLTASPSWWDVAIPFPAISYPNGYRANENPAKKRFKIKEFTTCGTYSKPEKTIISHISTATNPISELRAYPNPFSQELTLDFSLSAPGQVSISLFDISGQLVYEEKIQASTGKKQVPLLLPNQLSSGIYFLQVTTGQHLVMIKVLKQ